MAARSFGGTRRYEIVRLLGEGSFGAVYEVLDRERGLHLALKLLTRFDAPSLYRFKGEFRAFADVQHENLVQLYELASDGSDWFFTMELVDGLDWLSYVRGRVQRRHDAAAATMDPRSGRPPAPDELQLLRTEPMATGFDLDRLYGSARQLAAGVHALHGAGIVHRDVKPSNVLVQPDGRAVLVDFGLARPLAGGGTLQTGFKLAGTPAYMAPEQAMGAEVTPACDWYAVGAMLYEAIAGRLPFEGTPFEILSQKQSRDPPALTANGSSAHLALSALCGALLARDPSARPTGQTVLDVLGSHRARVRAVSAPRRDAAQERPVFVGRREALADLEAAFARACDGRTVMALVRGASGIGKSALVRALVDGAVAARGGLVLAGRCYEREAVSYKAFDSAIDALSRFLVQSSPAEAAATLPLDVAALARVFPVLDQVPAIAQSPRRALDAVDGQRLRTRAFTALRGLLARASDRRPIVLFLDDFQWADDESLALLRDLARGEPEPSMLVAVTFRDEDVGRSAPLDALLASSREAEAAGHAVVRVTLGPLAPSESRELAAATLGRAVDHPSVAAIAAESAGSPFFLGELVQFALSSGADQAAIRLDTVLEQRLARLSANELRVLQLLAVAGAPMERRAVTLAAQLGAQDAESVLRALHRAKLVRTAGSEREDQLECFHNRIREAVVAALGPEEKRGAHQRIAAALQSLREPDPEALFLHYEAGGLGERAAEHATASAERAERGLAFDHAARLYQSALALLPQDAPDRNGFVVRRAEALMRAGRGVESANDFLSAIDAAPPGEVLGYRYRAAEQLLFCGQLDRGLRIMQEICEQVGVTIPRTRPQAIVLIVLLSLWIRLRRRRWRARDPATVTPAQLTRADVCWSMAGGLSLVDQVISRPFSLRAMMAAFEVGDADRAVRAVATEAGFCSSQGGPRARRRADALFAIADAIPQAGNQGGGAFRRGVQGWSLYFFGEWRGAKERIDDSIAELTQRGLGSIWERDTLSLYSLMTRIYLGEIADMVRLWDQRLFDAQNRGDLFAETIYVTSRVNARWLLTDNPAQKRREVDDALRRWGQPGRFQIQNWFALQSHAQVDLYEGKPLDALRRIQEAWPALRRSFLLRVQNIRIEARSMLAFAAIRLAAEGTDRDASLALAEREARAITRERTAWGDPIALVLRAGIARRRGDVEAAVAMAEDATRKLDALGMAIHAASTRLWRSTFGAEEAAHKARSDAEAYFRGQAIKDPARVAAIFAPSG